MLELAPRLARMTPFVIILLVHTAVRDFLFSATYVECDKSLEMDCSSLSLPSTARVPEKFYPAKLFPFPKRVLAVLSGGKWYKYGYTVYGRFSSANHYFIVTVHTYGI